MLNLAASVACSVAVSVLLKVARGQNIQIAQAIAVNYPVAALLCVALLRPHPQQLLAPGTPWWVLALLGLLLPGVFLAMAGAVRRAGIVVSDAAQRLSLLVPLAAAFLLFNETASAAKLAGMAAALTALACLLWQPDGAAAMTRGDAAQTQGSAAKTPDNTIETRDSAAETRSGVALAPSAHGQSAHRAGTLVLLLCVWFGYGAIDILFKQMARSSVDFSSSLFAAFVLAGVLMGAWLAWRRSTWTRRSVAAGVVLGTLNFSNIYFYLRAHQQYPDNPTLVFAAMNIGVIALGTLVGALAFREGMPPGKGVGVMLAIVSIALLMPR